MAWAICVRRLTWSQVQLVSSVPVAAAVTGYAGGVAGGPGTGFAVGSGSSTVTRLPRASLAYCFHLPAGHGDLGFGVPAGETAVN